MKSFGTSGSVPFGNFSYSFYGLAAGGKSWAYVLDIYPEADYREIYKMAIQLILDQPSLFVKGVLHNYSMFFSNTSYGLFSYMSGERKIISTFSYLILLSLSGLGTWNWFRNREDPFLGFTMVSTIGLLMSVPFLPPTDAFRLRVYAVSIIIIALLPAMGLHWILTKLKLEVLNSKDSELFNNSSLPIYSGIIVLLVFLGPFASKGTNVVPVLKTSQCETAYTPVLVQYEPSAMVEFVTQSTRLLDWAPTFHIGTLHSNIHDFPNFQFMDWALEEISPDKAIFYSLDYISYQEVLVIIQSDILPTQPNWLELCGTRERKSEIARFNIYYAVSAFRVK
jgi:hypothetical protein